MYIRYLLYFSLLFLVGCAAYKELQPVPPILFMENGYIEIKDEDENFELSEGNKYFMKIPPPGQENIYLLLSFNEKSSLNTYLTRVFDDGEGNIIKMTDISIEPDKMSVYELDRTVPSFFWVIEEVKKDLVLNLEYRYIAAWRYKFETRHADFVQKLEQNTQPRNVYDAVGTSISGSEIDFSGELASVQEKSKNLSDIQNQLYEIESIFPADILNSQDASYLEYQKLKSDLSDEIEFQNNYKDALDLMSIVASSTVEPEAFIGRSSEFNTMLENSGAYPSALLAEAKKLTANHLDEIVPYFERELRKKKTSTPIDFDLAEVNRLFNNCNTPVPSDFRELENFVTAFNKRSESLIQVKADLEKIDNKLNQAGTWPSNTFFADQRGAVSQLNYALPSADSKVFGKYNSYACASLLNKELKSTKDLIGKRLSQLRRTEEIVPQINLYKNQGNYSGILGLLKQNADISFLMNKYANIDQLSLDQQSAEIRQALKYSKWAEAETSLKKLHLDKNFLNPKKTLPEKNMLVNKFEDSLYYYIEIISIDNANKFVSENLHMTEEIDSLYVNMAFQPVHIPTFSAKGPSAAKSKSDILRKRIDFIRNTKFPQSAIEALYKDFTGAVHERGVEKARAIVGHGQYYKGDDKKINNLIAECDPYAAKWVTKAKQYRKVFVLPTTSNPGGSNQFLMKINLQIPSDAKFPVYDVNVKLPMEIARQAGSKQWYKEITFNKKVLKNEGRFSISAPSADTNYEMQITPLQVNKTGNNVLEIVFDYDAFKVFEVSIMAQKPIIKKN
jgi:hypothetical protein